MFPTEFLRESLKSKLAQREEQANATSRDTRRMHDYYAGILNMLCYCFYHKVADTASVAFDKERPTVPTTLLNQTSRRDAKK